MIFDHNHNTLFSSQLLNEPNKPLCYTTIGWNGLPGINTLAHWAHSYVTMKMKCCELDLLGIIFHSSFSI